MAGAGIRPHAIVEAAEQPGGQAWVSRTAAGQCWAIRPRGISHWGISHWGISHWGISHWGISHWNSHS